MITREITYTNPSNQEETVVEVDLYRADFIHDTISTSHGMVPYEWTTEFTKEDVDTAIKNFLEGNPNEVNSNGVGFLVPVSGRVVEATEADYVVNYLGFKWREGSPYRGDCAIDLAFTANTTTEDIVAAVNMLIPG